MHPPQGLEGVDHLVPVACQTGLGLQASEPIPQRLTGHPVLGHHLLEPLAGAVEIDLSPGEPREDENADQREERPHVGATRGDGRVFRVDWGPRPRGL